MPYHEEEGFVPIKRRRSFEGVVIGWHARTGAFV
jgi:hypothetical protein